MPDIDKCAEAVRGELVSAAALCETADAQIDVFAEGGLTDACLAAFKAGKSAGQYGPKLPVPARAALIREFEKKLEACKAPAASPVPMRENTNIWD